MDVRTARRSRIACLANLLATFHSKLTGSGVEVAQVATQTVTLGLNETLDRLGKALHMSIDRGVAVCVLNVEHATVATRLYANAHHLAISNGKEWVAFDALGFQIDTRMEVVGTHFGKACRIERFEIERIAIACRVVLSRDGRYCKQCD